MINLSYIELEEEMHCGKSGKTRIFSLHLYANLALKALSLSTMHTKITSE